MFMVHEDTKQVVPLTDVLDVDRFLEDLKVINDAGRSQKWTIAQVALSIARNFRTESAPPGLTHFELLRVADGHTGRHMGIAHKARHKWRMLLVAGMWFQDLFNYDFRRTEMCIIPYGTQIGEISFCAYNTGIGFRQIIEKIFQTASTAEWYMTKGRHPVYAGGADVELPEGQESIDLYGRDGIGSGEGHPGSRSRTHGKGGSNGNGNGLVTHVTGNGNGASNGNGSLKMAKEPTPEERMARLGARLSGGGGCDS